MNAIEESFETDTGMADADEDTLDELAARFEDVDETIAVHNHGRWIEVAYETDADPVLEGMAEKADCSFRSVGFGARGTVRIAAARVQE